MKGTIVNKPLRKTASIFEKRTGTRVIRCVFPFSPFYVDEIKTILGKEWNAANKCWYIPLSLDNCFKLRDWQYVLTDELKRWANDEWKRKNNPISSIEIPGLKNTLFKYQEEGVIRAENFGGNALFADEMGLGKTIQAIAWCELHKQKRPVIVICPSFLKYNWEEEINNWIDGETIQILSGKKPNTELMASFILINYDVVSFWQKQLIALNAPVVIIDEAHYIKNDTGLKNKPVKRTKASKVIARKANHILALTGTPLENKTSEFYNIINLIRPDLFPVKLTFLHEYCGAKHNGFGWSFDGATKTKELHKILTENVMIRRLKKDVLKDLPKKTYSFIPLEINNRTKYEKVLNSFKKYIENKTLIEIRREFKEFLESDSPIEINDHKLKRLQEENASKANALTQLEELKQITVKGKLSGVFEWVDNFLETDKKLVVFCEHRFTINLLFERYKKLTVKVDGSLSAKQKHEAVKSFQNNKKIKLFIGNSAAEEGLTLTAASDVAHVEFPKKPGKLAQRTDRVHRIGQFYPVNVWYLVAVNTIEVTMAKDLDRKARMISQVVDGKEIDDTDLITKLLEEIKNGK